MRYTHPHFINLVLYFYCIEDPIIITREEKAKDKPSAASKRGFYKKALKRSSATDDIDSIANSKESGVTGSS